MHIRAAATASAQKGEGPRPRTPRREQTTRPPARTSAATEPSLDSHPSRDYSDGRKGRVRRTLLTCALLAMAACGGSPGAPSDADVISGGDRFGGDHPAADAGELASFRYAIYVDEARSDAEDVSCATAASSGRFACTARLPAMSAGAHTVQVAAFVTDGGAVRE